MIFAMGVAVATDVLQFSLGPLGWTFADEVLDVIALILISRAVGFHPLLLPTFVLEFFPVIDMLPTWSGCTGAVIMLRRRSQPIAPPIQATVISEPPEFRSGEPVRKDQLLLTPGEQKAAAAPGVAPADPKHEPPMSPKT